MTDFQLNMTMAWAEVLALLTQQPRVRKFFSGKFNVAEINWRPCLEASGQRLDYVNWTNLVLASGKLVLQKDPFSFQGVLELVESKKQNKNPKYYYLVQGMVALLRSDIS